MKHSLLLISLLSAPVLCLPARALNVGGIITTTTTWHLSDSPVIVTSDVTVNGVRINIEPGVVVKFNNGLNIIFNNGTLSAPGTLANPIYFTSINDNSVGGTTGNGSPAPGSWQVVEFFGSASSATLTNVHFRYGGNSSFGFMIDAVNGSTVSMSGGEVSFSQVDGMQSDSQSVLSASSVTFQGNLVWGFNAAGLVPTLNGNTFTGVKGARIAAAQTVQADGNTFQNLTNLAMQVDPGVTLNGFDNTVAVRTSTGGLMGVDLSFGTVSRPTTWVGSALPFVMRTGGITFSAGVPLRLTAGAVVKVSGGGTALFLHGGLTALGTPGQPITFTSLKDDLVGGDTNGDGSATSPVAGDWASVILDGGTSNATLMNVHFKYGGNVSFGFMLDAVNGSTVSMSGGEVSFSQVDGMQSDSRSVLSASGVAFQGSLGWGFNAGGSAPALNGNTFTGAKGARIVVPQTVQANGNTFQNMTNLAMQVDPGVTLNGFGNTVAVRTSTGGIMGVDLLGGTVNIPTVWVGSALPFINRSNGITFAPGAGLTITPGTVIKALGAFAGVTVQGGLTAMGTSAQPINFTSLTDDSVGGDTNGDGSATAPLPGDWPSIQVNGSSAALANVHFRYGGNVFFSVPMLYATGGSTVTLLAGDVKFSQTVGVGADNASVLSVSSATIVSNAIGVFANSRALVNVHQSSIFGNSSFGVENFDSAHVVQAQFNWWGSSTGPRNVSNPGGTGDVVSNFVNFIPFLTSPVQAVPPQVISLTLLDPSPTQSKTVRFQTTFSAAMNTAVTPLATFGQSSPFETFTTFPGVFTSGTVWQSSATILGSAPDGAYFIRIASATDVSGTQVVVSTFPFYVVDNTPPSVAITSPTTGATISRPFTATASASDASGIASVVFSVDGVILSTVTTPPFNFFWDTRNFPDGSHVLAATATDRAGNIAQSSVTVTLQYSPPAPPVITSPAAGFATNIATITVSGTADPLTSVDLLVNGLDVATGPVSSSFWSIRTVLPRQGNIVLTAIAFENRGFSLQSVPVTGVFTTTAPRAPELVSASPGPSGSVLLAWSPPSTGTVPSFYRVYRSTNDADLPFGRPAPAAFLLASGITQTRFTDAPTVDDLYFYALTAVDKAGNESALSETVYALTDRVPPTAVVSVATVTTPVGPGSYPLALTLSKPLSQPPILTFTPQGQSPIPLNLNAVTATLWRSTLTVTTAMSSGAATFGFQGIDLAGNVGTRITSGSTLPLDTVGPIGTVTLSKTSPLSVGLLTFNLSLDRPSISTPTLSFTPQGGSPVPIPLASTGAFNNTSWSSAIVITSTTGEGTAILAYSASDSLGNLSTKLSGGTTFFIIDTIPPGPPLSSRANPGPGGIVTLSWSAPFGEPPSSYNVYRAGVRIATGIPPASDGSGTFLDHPTPGAHMYRISSVDLAGNESAQTDPTAVSRATPPSPPINLTSSINSFGQINLTWQAGSTDTASFNLYRATSPITSIAGVSFFRNAVSPFLDSPAVNAKYHYVVTALDSVGNESQTSTETLITFSNAPPVITITGVANGGFFNANVFPAFTAADLTLDTASVRGFLDGVPFVSGSTVSAEGLHSLNVTASNAGGHVATSTATFTIDKTPPVITFSVPNGRLFTSTASVTITVADLNPGTSSYFLFNALTGATVPYQSGGLISQNGSYTLTAGAVDLAGNSSTATLSFSLEVGPLAPARLQVLARSAAAILSWTQPEPDVVAYRVYRDGQRISASLYPNASFVDAGFTQGTAHVYQVSAVDAQGVEGAKSQATVRALTLASPTLTLTRGYFDAVSPTVTNADTVAFSVGPSSIEVVDADGVTAFALAPQILVPAGGAAALQAVIATPVTLGPAASITVTAPVPTDPGASVSVQQTFTVPARNPASPQVDVLPGALVPGTLSPVQVRFYNRGSAPMDVVTGQITNSTFAAVNNVQVQLQTAQGTLLSAGGILQTGNGANAVTVGGKQFFFVTIPPGSSFLFDPVRVLVPNTANTSVMVAAFVSTPTFNLPGIALPGTRGFSSSAAQAITSQVPYTATAFPDRPFYDQGSRVTILGQALDSVSGFPVPNAAVTAHVVSNGFDRHISAMTDGSGAYSAAFFPLPNESGLYNLFAAAPSVVTHAAQSSFTIVGFGFSPTAFNATLSANSTFQFNITLQNTGASALTGLSASTASLFGSGVSLALDPSTLPGTLAAGAQANVSLTLSALPFATTSTLVLSVAESHGFVRAIPITATVVPAQVFPVATPNNLLIGMLAGTIRTQVITLTNKGFQTWRGVALSSPAVSFVQVQGPLTLGDIPPGGNVNFTVSIAPPSNLPNGTFAPNPLMLATSLNAAPLPIQAAITVTASLTGDVLFNVINAEKPRDSITGLGVGVPGSTVTLVSLDVQGLSVNANSDLNGAARFSAIPSGNYAWRVTAAGFQSLSGTAVIQPGIVNEIQAVIPTAVVSYQWTVTPTTILDQYNIVLDLTFKTNVLAPALIVDPPVINLPLSGGQTAFTQFTVTNKGLISAFNVNIAPSNADPAMQITLPFTTIPELKAGQTVTVPVQVNLLHASCHSNNVNLIYTYTCQFGTQVTAQAQPVSFTAGDSCPVNGAPSAGAPTPVLFGGGGGGFSFIGGGTYVPLSIPGNSPAPACAAPGAPPNTRGRNGSCPGTSPATGFLSYLGSVFGFGSGSPALAVAPNYNSRQPGDSPLGFGWFSDLFASVRENADGTFTATDKNGTEYVFVPLGPFNQPLNGSGPQFAQPVDFYSTLNVPKVVNGVPQSLDQRDKDGTVTHYQLFRSSSYLPVLLTDRNGNTITYQRDTNGNLLKVTDIHGRTLNFTYNSQGRIASATDSAGRTTSYAYDALGNKTSDTDPNGDVTRYAYDSSHRLTQVTYPNGGHTFYTYTVDGKVATESQDSGNNQKTYVYNSSTTLVTDALNRVTEYDWIENSGLRKFVKIVDPNGGITSFAYDTNMNLVSQTDPLGRLTKFQYDNNGNVTATTDPNNNATQIAYEPNFNQATSVIDPKANRTNLFYDARGNLVQVQDALSNFTNMAYDGQGHVTATKDPFGNITAFAYNGNGALTSVADPLGRTTNMIRDALSRVTQNTDPAGKQTAFQYDAQSNLTQVTDALSGLTKYNYTPGHTGRLLNTVTDAKSHSTNFSYDPIARLTTVTNALSQAKNFSYDAKGNLSQTVDAKGQTINFTYDSLDRLIAKKVPEGDVTYTYDPSGNLTQVTNYNGSVIGMSYDGLNRVTQVRQTLPGGFSAAIGYSYDADGNRTGMTTPWGNFAYAYDALNRLTSVTNPQGKVVTFAYDALGRRTKMIYPNGIQTTYAYDAAGQLTQILHQRTSDNTPIAFANYTYDATGNRLTMQDMDGTHSYTYDNLNRLLNATHPSSSFISTKNEAFTYDAVGNRLSDANITNYQYDAANRLTSNSSFTYTYDANGNQTSKKDTSNNQTSYIYDSENRLLGANLPVGIPAQYKYSATGRRIEKSLSTRTTRYIYDGFNILAILDGNNNLITLFTNGLGINEPLIMRQSNGNEFFYHLNALHSVLALTDSLSNLIERVAYTGFGQPTFINMNGPPSVSSQSFVGSPLAYAGVQWDPETGLYNNGARYYDPFIGRFTEPDPTGLLGGVNYYVYVLNNPVNFTDPLGLSIATYNPNDGTLIVVGDDGTIYGPFIGGNLTSRDSKGPIPPGIYKVGTPINNNGPDRQDWDRIPSEGPFFIPILTPTLGRTKIGIHGGRSSPFDVTKGCIRTSNKDISTLVDIYNQDPITDITILPGEGL